MVSDRVSGASLDTVWHEMNETQHESIKVQLKHQLSLYRSCTQPYIGRLNRKPARNVYEKMHFRFMGPFESEEEFDDWCLSHLKSSISKAKGSFLLPRMRGTDSKAFVLTHGDLAARNIMVEDGVITGIVDWENSGFLPEYMEYVLAMQICSYHEEWRKPVLKEILKPCGSTRLKFQAAITNRGW